MLGIRIAALRKSRGWSQAELGRRLQISPSAVGMYEQGRREPSLELLVEMTKVFDVTADFLLTGSVRAEKDSLRVSEAVENCRMQMAQRLKNRGASALTAEEFAVLLTAVMTGT